MTAPWHKRHSVQALLGLAAILMVGVAVLDDYGASADVWIQHDIATSNFAFISGQADSLPQRDVDRYYGVAFELPLLLVERLLGLEDSHDILLSRHLLTHLFFLAGALCCSLLTYRIFNNRLLALLALLLFVLHPRLYAHSFFNSKDLPFLSMFMICLYLTHWAFKRDGLRPFLMLGCAVGILINLRIMGIMLLPMVLAMRALDLLQAPSEARKHVAATGVAFATACLCTLYAVSPYLWANPLELLAALQELSRHPVNPSEMFQGNWVSADSLPPHFIPTWIAVSTPPATLLLAAVGLLATCGQGLARPMQALNNTELRFGLFLAACLALPLAAVALAKAHMYDAWRQMFFVYAPMCLLAAAGLHWIGAAMRKLRSPWRTAGYALVGMGMAVTAAEMVRMHPHQQAYFNLLVDRRTPERLRTQYLMDSWNVSCREGLEHLLARHPQTPIRVRYKIATNMARLSLSKEDRERLILVWGGGDFRIKCGRMLQKAGAAFSDDAVFSRKLYNSTIVRVTVQAKATSDFQAIRELTAGGSIGVMLFGPPRAGVTRHTWDFHLPGRAVLETLSPLKPARNGGALNAVDFIVTDVREPGLASLTPQNRRFFLYSRAEYLGQHDFFLGDLMAQSDFEVYRKDGALIYFKQPCSIADTAPRFLLHILPENLDDLPMQRRQYGFDNLDFAFSPEGRHFWLGGDQGCMVRVNLPSYGIAGVRTGQFDHQGRIWQADFPLQQPQPAPPKAA